MPAKPTAERDRARKPLTITEQARRARTDPPQGVARETEP